MVNMAYCRFQNTLQDLEDCEDHMDDMLSGYEAAARVRLVELCARIAANHSDLDFPENEDEDD